MNQEKRPITLEDILRLKRAERPPAEFWESFDRELRAKQLAALVEKRPWWRSLPRAFSLSGFTRFHLPVGATAVLAITFLATRLLFQRGRIDTDGAADRINALLEHAGPFPEAEDWLAELEGRTEPSAVPKEALENAPKAADTDGEEKTSPTHRPPSLSQRPPSHAPSVPRARSGASGRDDPGVFGILEETSG